MEAYFMHYGIYEKVKRVYFKKQKMLFSISGELIPFDSCNNPLKDAFAKIKRVDIPYGNGATLIKLGRSLEKTEMMKDGLERGVMHELDFLLETLEKK